MRERTDTVKYSGETDLYGRINKLMTFFVALNVLIFILGILNYKEKFLFGEYPLSYLGGTKTVTGIPNTASWLIFSSGMIFCSILCFYIGSVLIGRDKIMHQGIKRYLFFLSGTGYLIMLMPYNVNNSFHSIGTAIVFMVLWIYIFIVILELNRRIEKYKIWLFHIILHGTILPYAFFFFINSPIQRHVQKYAVVGLLLMLKWVSAQAVKVFQKKTE